jgi:hypothetical protein
MCVQSGLTFAFLDDVRRATAQVPEAQDMLHRLGAGELQAPWRFDDGLLLHDSRIFLPDHGDLRRQALSLAHSAGHEGVQKTLHRLRSDFYIPGDRVLVQDWVRSCSTCQRNKTEARRLAGLLQPLDVPAQVWADISIDFIEGLPKMAGKSVILTVVDRFSKYAHFISLGHPYTAASVARAFFDGIVRLHGFPTSIVSDRDLLTVNSCIKVRLDLQANKSPVVVKGPFFPRVVNPRYRIRGTMCNARIQSSKAR